MTQAHVEPLPIPLIKVAYNGKSDKYFVKLKLRRDPTSSMLKIYEFRMYLFDNGDPEEFLFLISYFNMTLTESGMLKMGANIQYLFTLVHGDALHQFDLLSDDVESTETLTVDYIIKDSAL